jgi:hypothetical protein
MFHEAVSHRAWCSFAPMFKTGLLSLDGSEIARHAHTSGKIAAIYMQRLAHGSSLN